MILKMLEKFSGEIFGDVQSRIVWGQVLPTDRIQLVTNETALVVNGIHSRRRAMDEVGVKDPEAEFAHWLEEEEKILQISTNNTNNSIPPTPKTRN